MPEIPRVCGKCGSRVVFVETEDGITESYCPICSLRTEISRETRPSIIIPEDEIPIKPLRRIRGISAKESRRLYRHTPAGKAAWERYRYSELFYEAHERHRHTETYRETQRRFKEKQKLFKMLLYPPPESTCPLNLFFKGPNGEVYHNPEKCNYNNGDCTLTCMDFNSQ